MSIRLRWKGIYWYWWLYDTSCKSKDIPLIYKLSTVTVPPFQRYVKRQDKITFWKEEVQWPRPWTQWILQFPHADKQDDQNGRIFGDILVLKEVVSKWPVTGLAGWEACSAGSCNLFVAFMILVARCVKRNSFRKILSKHQSLTIHDPLRLKDPGKFWCFRL